MNLAFFGDGMDHRKLNQLHDEFDFGMGQVTAATALPLPRDLAIWLLAKEPAASRDKAVLMMEEWLASGRSELGAAGRSRFAPLVAADRVS
jgi:hypothetical protein